MVSVSVLGFENIASQVSNFGTCHENVTKTSAKKKTSPYGHLAKLVPQKRHHMGLSQISCPKNIGATACRAWAGAETFNGLQKVLQIRCLPGPTTL